MSYKLTEDRVLVLMQDTNKDETTSGGIVIPALVTSKESRQIATVVSVGPGTLLRDGETVVPINLKEGDVVVLGKFAGTDIKLDEITYTIVRAHECLAVIEEA